MDGKDRSDGARADDTIDHFRLGCLRRYSEHELIGHIDIDTGIRTARLDGHADAEVLVAVGPGTADYDLQAVLSPTHMEISFDFGGLDLLVVDVDASGRVQGARLA